MLDLMPIPTRTRDPTLVTNKSDFENKMKDKNTLSLLKTKVVKKWEGYIKLPFFKFLDALLEPEQENRIDVISAVRFLKHYFIYSGS